MVVFIFCPNLLNLPEKIFAGTEEVSYVYSATGQKLATKAGSSTTYYRGSFIYNDDELDHILQPEGIIRKTTGAYVYYYAKQDHLGSTRVLCHEANGVMKADQVTDYYPFGVLHHNNGTNVNRYLFSGKELQDQTVNGTMLQLYDFGARNYDPMLGRWFNIDPLAAKYYAVSPYVYCGNNPINRVDPDGRDWVVANGTYNYAWRDDINAKSIMPEGYQYVGATSTDILNHMGINYNFSQLSTNDIGMVAMDAELGQYAVSHLVNVKEKSNASITANVSYNLNDKMENNSLGRQFNGISVNVTEISSNSGVDGDMKGGGLVSVQYGNKTYHSNLKTPEDSYIYQTGTTVTTATVNIPKSDLSVGSKFSQIQIKGNWFVQKNEGMTPIVRHALVPYPLSFKHTWIFKK